MREDRREERKWNKKEALKNPEKDKMGNKTDETEEEGRKRQFGWTTGCTLDLHFHSCLHYVLIEMVSKKSITQLRVVKLSQKKNFFRLWSFSLEFGNSVSSVRTFHCKTFQGDKRKCARDLEGKTKNERG